ncbi:tyrosine-type recombinase/integrase [Loigolactobacillus zhaoyuanensis]|uniref:Tyrosine-type recombinase/integrase n=1 Tax=Loigolactobacillus zhaoyuanensis TaxID=2486017 RepID=A0ABW8UBD6_9LACO
MASYKKISTGWQFRISYKKRDGTYGTKSGNNFRTKKAAEVAAHNLELELGKGLKLEAGKEPFVTYLKRWYRLYKESSLRYKTKASYNYSIDRATEFFGLTPIEDITEDDYQAFLVDFGTGKEVFKKPHAKETAAKIHTHLKSAFKKAVKQGIIIHNPAEDAKVVAGVAKKSEELKYLSLKDQELLRAVLTYKMRPNNPSRYICLLSLDTGLRISEVLGLTWDCVDFKNNMITVNKTWDYQNTKDFDKTKNPSSMRTIKVNALTLQRIVELKKYQEESNRQFKDLVFLTYQLLPPTDNAVNKTLKTYLKRAGIKTMITHHGLRHSHVSLLIHKGFDIQWISKRVGHENASTTINIYMHILDEMQQINDEKLELLAAEEFDNAKTMQNVLKLTDFVDSGKKIDPPQTPLNQRFKQV